MEIFIRLISEMSFCILCSLCASENVAEDVTQETFVKALKAIDTFDGSRDIRAWLFTIARNTYYTYCKRQKIYADRELTGEYGGCAGRFCRTISR